MARDPPSGRRPAAASYPDIVVSKGAGSELEAEEAARVTVNLRAPIRLLVERWGMCGWFVQRGAEVARGATEGWVIGRGR